MLKKYFWNASMREPFFKNSFYWRVLRKITNSVTKMTIFLHERKLEIFFSPYVLDLIDLMEQKIMPRFQFKGKTDVWISQVRSVKDMYRIYLAVNKDIWQILNIYRKKRRNCKPSWTSTSCWPARTWPQRKTAQFAKSRKRDGISFTRAEKSKWGFKART